MSVIQTHAQTHLEPAEFDYTSPCWCMGTNSTTRPGQMCLHPHDWDEDTGRNVIEGGPDGDFVVCDTCDLYCACGDSVLEWGTEPHTKSKLFLKAGTIIREGVVTCLACETEGSNERDERNHRTPD